MKNLVSLIKLTQPDLMIVSSEGMKFSTWRLLLALHSPLLTELLHTLKPSEEGILAISLPLPYTSVSSMLTILSEGGNLDCFGEAAQLLGNRMLLNSFASNKTAGSSKFESSHGRNPRSLFKVNSTDKDTNRYSLINLNSSFIRKPAFEMLSKSDMLDLNGVNDQGRCGDTASEKQSICHVSDFKNEHESESFDNVVADMAIGKAHNGDKKVIEGNYVTKMGRGEPNNGDTGNNREETSDMKADAGDSKQIEEERIENFIWVGEVGTLTPGLTFPDYDSMMAAFDEWSEANFSPMITRSSGDKWGNHIFCCPHSKKKRQKEQSLRIRQTKKITIEYVDCPFLIITKLKADDSYIVSRAETEHRGHNVSEEQFQKYRRSRRFTTDQKDAVLALMTQGGKLPEIAKMLSDLTGRNYQPKHVNYLVRKLQKQFLVIDPETGEKKVEVPAEGFPLSPTRLEMRRSALQT